MSSAINGIWRVIVIDVYEAIWYLMYTTDNLQCKRRHKGGNLSWVLTESECSFIADGWKGKLFV